MKHLAYYIFLLLMSLFSLFCNRDIEKPIYDFNTVKDLFSDPDITHTCLISTQPNRATHTNKYVYFYNGLIINLKEDLQGVQIYSNTLTEKQELEIIENFKLEKKALNSKGVLSACISADSIIKLNIANFNLDSLRLVDTLKTYKDYNCINFCIRYNYPMKFIKREEGSFLFYYDKCYFYYSKF